MLRPYETTFVIDSLLRSDEIDDTIRRYLKFISDNGGEIRRVERWGKKRLAYEIKKRQYGYYVYVRFDGPPTIVAALEREYRLDENILRYLTIQLDKRALAKERMLIEKGLIKERVEQLEEIASSEPEESTARTEEATEPKVEGGQESSAEDEGCETAEEGSEGEDHEEPREP